MILFLLLSLKVFSAAPVHWDYIVEIGDKHEFYQGGEAITKPANTWQVLFSLVYLDSQFQRNKDCVIFRVPGVEEGVLKIKTVPASEKCEKFLLRPGDREIKSIKGLVFDLKERELKLDLTFIDFKTEVFEIRLQGQFERPKPQLNLSSAEFKSPKIILLAPETSKSVGVPEIKDGTICHNINDECEENGQSTCSQCASSFYEIQNGCMIAPKYCGQVKCGIKGNPACRRGFKWQRDEQESYDCRVDSSFAYCASGLSIQCEGKKAYCR